MKSPRIVINGRGCYQRNARKTIRARSRVRAAAIFLPGCLLALASLFNSGCHSPGKDRGEPAQALKSGHATLALDRQNGEIMGQSLVDAATGFQWLAPDASFGPWCLSGTNAAWPGHLPLTSWRQQGGQRDGGERTADWVVGDGASLHWIVKAVPNSSVLEFQARLKNDGLTTISNIHELGPLRLFLRGDADTLKVHWVRRDTYKEYEVVLNDSFSVSGGSWNAPESAGWVAVENTERKEVLFLGGEWESYWRVSFQRQGEKVLLRYTLERFSRDLLPGQEMVSPLVFVGLSHGDLDDAGRDLHDYLNRHVIPAPLPDFPWAIYNIWGTAGDGSDEKAILDEIPLAAKLGFDLFYVDAGWYENSCTNRSGDWFQGLGNWQQEDFRKYPHGLANISDKVHAAGMKFGLWFNPQMVDSRLVGNRIPEKWVAKKDGKPLVTAGTASSIAQICLGDPEVVEFLEKSIASAVLRYHLDWVKMDGSGLPGVVCNFSEHGHSEGDGALAEIRGELELYRYLHDKFPDLVLEQCGYGSRLDYGLAPYMRANWLDDSSGDAIPVRRRVINGAYVYPSAYLEGWVYKGPETDTQKDPDILNTIVRSRMMGCFGVGCLINSAVERISLYPPEAIAALKRNIADYKKYRHLLLDDVYHFPGDGESARLRDAIQFCQRDGAESVLFVFQNGNACDNPNPTPFNDSALHDVIHDTNITAASGDSQWGFVAAGTCNGAGLDFDTGRRHGTDLKDMWLGSATGGTANPHPGTAKGANWIGYAFDKSYPLGKTWIWNWNNEGAGSATGLNHVTIEYSETGGTDSAEWKRLGDFQFSRASGAPNDLGFAGPDFQGVSAKYVVLTVHPLTGDMATSGSWGAGDCGLSEIRFFLNTAAADAEAAEMESGKNRAPRSGPERFVKLRGLRSNATYTVTSLNTGASDTVPGSELLDTGVKVSLVKPGSSEILLFKRIP
jgi:hypothetical protein